MKTAKDWRVAKKKKSNVIKIVVLRDGEHQKELAERIDRLAEFPGESCQSVGFKCLANGIKETEAGIELIRKKTTQP